MLGPAQKPSPGTCVNGRHMRAEAAGGRLTLLAQGAWVVCELTSIEAEWRAIAAPDAGDITLARLDLSGLTGFDTAGAWLAQSIVAAWTAGGIEARLSGVSEDQAILLEEVARHSAKERPPPRRRNTLADMPAGTMRAMTAMGRDSIQMTTLLGQVTHCGVRMLAAPWRFRHTSFINHLERAGLHAVPIVALMCLLIGAVIMQQSVLQLRTFGAEALSVDMLGILTLREIGVLLCAIMVAGRSASSFTAEIGTMKMREEIDAMRTLGIDPIATLVLPRILALVAALPLLVFISDMMCLLGGAIMARIYLDLSFAAYFERLNGAVELRHFFAGMVKAPFAALVIGLVGCLEGLNVEGSAESVGSHVTSAVVKAIFLVMALDGGFAIFLSACGF
jgi:phospholipid/cholesterol/gamma-HCH transport system permease protein